MPKNDLFLTIKLAVALALVALPAFSMVQLPTHVSAPVAYDASTTSIVEAVEQTPTMTTSDDTTGWD